MTLVERFHRDRSSVRNFFEESEGIVETLCEADEDVSRWVIESLLPSIAASAGSRKRSCRNFNDFEGRPGLVLAKRLVELHGGSITVRWAESGRDASAAINDRK